MTNTVNKPEAAESVANLVAPTVVSKPKNALVHGTYASDIVLPWESAEDLERLHNDLVAEWSPQGRMEKETVLGLTRLIWLKHRVMRSTQLAARKEPMVAELEASGAKTWSEVADFLKGKAVADNGVMEEARKALVELQLATKNASEMMTANNRDTQEIYRRVETMDDMFKRFVMPVYNDAFEKVHGKNHGPNESIRAPDMESITPIEAIYHPSYLEKIVRLEGSLDARIDKTLYRLSFLKEIKRLAKSMAPKQIASPPIATSAPAQSD